MTKLLKQVPAPSWLHRLTFIIFISKKYKEIFQGNPLLSEGLKCRETALSKIPVRILKFLLPHLYLNAHSIKSIWLNYTHQELRLLFDLKNSPVINKQISVLKELSDRPGNLGTTSLAFFVFCSFTGKNTVTITKYIDLILNKTNSAGKKVNFNLNDSTRYEMLDVSPDNVQEVQLALTLISDRKLQAIIPSSYEVLVLLLVNGLSDVGRLVSKGALTNIDFKYDNLKDFSEKYNRRWLFHFGENEKIIHPYWLQHLHNKKIYEFTVHLAKDCKDMYWWAIKMENCIYSSVRDALEQRSFFLVLKENDQIKYLVEINEDGTISEIKGKYNASVTPTEQFRIQNEIYKNLNEII